MIISKESSYSYAKRESGGKGFNLYLMSQEGLPVPEWRVLAASFFKQFKEKSDLEFKITNILERSGDNFLQASKQIEELIVGATLDPQIEAEFKKAYSPFKGRLIAVRSSAVDEDSAQHSFAGQLSTYLFVDSFEKALLSIKKCWASGFSERGLAYRKQNKLLLSHAISVAVVLQEMIDSEISGVLFTCDPISGDPEKIMINSVYGVGEGLVSGLLEPDSYLLKKSDGSTETSEIVSKKSKVVRGGGEDGTKEVPVAAELQDRSSLTDVNLKELANIGRQIERFYRFPQDIEWGMQNNKLYILQSRPVTTAVKNGDGILYIWDNSNIIESYGGITLPLTFSFARFVYHQVYVQFCEILLVPQSEIKNMDYFLRNMLGSFYGRVYYNILNWYKLTSILPGFKYNRSFMETMMGTPHSLSDEIADRIKPPGFHETFSSKVRRFITGFKFLYFHWTIESMVKNFLTYFHKVYDEYRTLNYSRMTSDQIWGHYQELERRVLRQWQAPIINDYLCMVHFGLLKKLTGSWLAHLGDSLQNDLLCGEGNLESAEPTRAIITMATKINLNQPLKQMILDTPAEDCLEALKQSNFTEVRNLVDTYIDKYGFRCMSEMKLEQKDLHQEPAFLFVCLKNYLRGGFPDLEAYEKREHEIRSGAEKKVKAALSGFKKIVYLWSLKHARRAVRNRENTRFCRTRIYGVVRKMFFGIGRDFTLRGIIKQPEDIFYITLQELAGALEGSLFNQNLAAQIELRRAEYKTYEDTEPTARFMTRGPVYWMNSHFGEEKVVVDMSDVPPNGLKGIGCCPGIVEGTVKVILSPNDNMELNKEILVTLRTDPGWIPLYPSASALLVERGGLLSHSAIVAREMGLPTVVGVKGLTEKLKTGMRVRINGQTGIIEVL